jgi:hypothetical protein
MTTHQQQGHDRMSDTTMTPERGSIIQVWIDSAWKAAYDQATPDQRCEMLRRGVKLGQRSKPTQTDPGSDRS